jgi:hypothetical protein
VSAIPEVCRGAGRRAPAAGSLNLGVRLSAGRQPRVEVRGRSWSPASLCSSKCPTPEQPQRSETLCPPQPTDRRPLPSSTGADQRSSSRLTAVISLSSDKLRNSVTAAQHVFSLEAHVGENSFLSSPLWRRTLESDLRRDPHAVERERLRASYLLTRTHAATLLAELSRSVPDFTVHDITHVDALWETASLVAGPQIVLTPAEAYVLGCAFIFHDAAMGLAAYKRNIADVLGDAKWRDLLASVFVTETDRWPSRTELDAPPQEVLMSCVSQAIRETHATHAAILVEQPWRTSSENDFYLLQDSSLRESYGPLIGELASSHWWNVDDLAGPFRNTKGSLPWQPSEWIVDPLKLACVLRLADATQLDGRRAPTFLFALRRPEGISRDHWRFQEHMGRPQLVGDRITYSAFRPFDQKDASAWWLALDYLRQVDSELKKVDALLYDLGRPRLAARAVASVESPGRFADIFPVKGWRPIDADVQISDVRALITALGGEQLYGREAEVAVRELVQNAQDAVLARRVVDPSPFPGHVKVRLLHNQSGNWVLEVSDDGIGMDEEILVHGLLDFGACGWRTNVVRTKFVGLTGGGFRPRGRFGIGFFSVFMLGDKVEIITRRFDVGQTEARRLTFDGRKARPLLTAVATSEYVSPGTTVRVVLTTSPYDEKGIFRNTEDDRLDELIYRLILENDVPIEITECEDGEVAVLQPFDLSSAEPEAVFDRLYPCRTTGSQAREHQRLHIRTEFARRATSVFAGDGQKIGLAALGRLHYLAEFNLPGISVVSGFRADEHYFFSGYFLGRPNRASRDNAEFEATGPELQRWLISQEQQMRDLHDFNQSIQLENASALYRGRGGVLANDHCIAMVSNGPITVGQIAQWAAHQKEIFISQGWPLSCQTRPPRVVYYPTGAEVVLPDGWILPHTGYEPVLDHVIPTVRDSAYEQARHHRKLTWQKRWWLMSGNLRGLLVREICRAWVCEVGDVLGPVADRNWNDFATLSTVGIGPLSILRLNRPGERPVQ